MKRIVVFLLLLSFVPGVWGQDRYDKQTMYDYFQQQQHRRNKTGWLLLGCGTGAMVVGFIGFAASWESSSYATTDAFGYLFSAGFVASIVSIPFFIGAHTSKKKAASLVFEMQNPAPPDIRGYAFHPEPIPAVKLTIRF
ncbi:hypothetical protein INQ51_07305 [Maribellus sp. CM-23]|uniref:hypothetical protein n=1 Tax=Maribellus sp. CM-23 TaxID=2781026 RepID=UPI001F41208C|nr:hypothetical protein [Maribellus sp. CM-23]MCE4564114.1 hypothetical protein [Maribellus sp. CM-23]